MIGFLKWLMQAFTWFVVVAPWEQGVRVRLGRHVRLLRAGFYVRVPFIDRVFKQSVRRRLSIMRPQTLTTRDGKVVTVSGSLGFAIKDILRLYNTLDCAQDTLENEAAGLLAEFVARHDYAECQPPALEAAVMAKLDLGRYGLDGQAFRINSFLSVRTVRLVTGDLPAWSSHKAFELEEREPNG